MLIVNHVDAVAFISELLIWVNMLVVIEWIETDLVFIFTRALFLLFLIFAFVLRWFNERCEIILLVDEVTRLIVEAAAIWKLDNVVFEFDEFLPFFHYDLRF